jgi:hypothetical protein
MAGPLGLKVKHLGYCVFSAELHTIRGFGSQGGGAMLHFVENVPRPRNKIRKGGIVCFLPPKSALRSMSRRYKAIPQYISTIVGLSDDSPSGLKWLTSNARRSAGDPVTRKDACDGFYRVSIDNTVYLAHRVVYYLRTGVDPGGADVVHGPDNPDRDNRKSLILSYTHQKKSSVPFDTDREEQGNLINLN